MSAKTRNGHRQRAAARHCAGAPPRAARRAQAPAQLVGILQSRRGRLGPQPFVGGDDLPALVAGAGALAYPSRFDGFGLPPLEAMAHGTPVVTSNTSSLPEVVGNAAVLVNPENVFDIMRALHRVLLDQPLREKLKQRGYEQVTKFSWDAAARQILAVYERTTGAERASPPRAEAEPVPRAANS